MKLQLKHAVSILLCAFVALSLVPAGGAAPLNPDLNKSFAEDNTTPAEPTFTDIESHNDDNDEWNNHTNTSPDTTVCITAFTTNTLRVPSDNYSTIQSAVDDAHAGDTVIVESGTYNENVAIITPITLRGIDTGNGFPVIDACGNGTGITVTAVGTVLDRLVVINSGKKKNDVGVLITAADITLVNLTAITNRIGFFLDESYNCNLVDCIAQENSWNGIKIQNSKGSTLTRCISRDNYNGFEIDTDWYFHDLSANDRNSDQIQAIVDNCNNCIPSVIHSSVDEFPEYIDKEMHIANLTQQKEFGECSDYWGSAVVLSTSSTIPWEPGNITLSQCTSVNNSWNGIRLKGGNNIITKCTFSDNGGYGIQTFHAWNNTVTDCTVCDNDDIGIALYYSNNCTLSRNTMVGNRWNFYICASNTNDFQNYIDVSNTLDGKSIYYLLNVIRNPVGNFTDAGIIYAINCRNLEIRDLTLSGNQYGIYFLNTSDSTLDHINAIENGNGICLSQSTRNIVTECTASENDYSGITLSCSKDCTLIGNQMSDNSRNFYLTGQNENEFHHSVSVSNTVDGKSIYYLLNTSGNPSGGFANAGTIYAINCRNIEIRNQNLSKNLYGAFFMNTTDSILDQVCATNNQVGFKMINSDNCSMYHSYTSNNLHGVILLETERNILINCRFFNNIFYDISLQQHSNNNTVTDCTFQNCRSCGITLGDHSTENSLYLNTIGKNTILKDNCQENIWNSPTPLTYLYGERMWERTSPMGNYWGAAYNGADLNNDGIGDTPFTGTGFTDNYPLMEPPGAYIFVEDTDTGDGNDAGNGHVGAAGNLNAGDTVTMHFDGTAVTGVTITAAGQINTMVVTVGPVPNGPEGLNGPVYQYLEADLIHITDDTISEADFTFSVPTRWLTAQGLSPADVVLWRYHDGVWVPLPTEVVSEKGDHVVYRAVSPGFSYFAVGIGEAVSKQTAETTPSAGAETEAEPGTPPAGTPIVTPASDSTPEPAIPSEPSGDAPKAAPAATPPQQSPAGMCTILAAVGTVCLLFRRR